MRLLNLGCGGQIAPDPFTNLDELRSHLAVGTPERTNLDALPNYVDFKLMSGPMPFEPDTFNGILCQHVAEHFSLHDSISLLKDCLRILKPRGILLVSVPDASYFRRVHSEDTDANAVRLFGEPIFQNEAPNFLHYGLLTRNHLQAFCEDSLWAVFRGAGFQDFWIERVSADQPTGWADKDAAWPRMAKLLNRLPFSLIMTGAKP